MKKILCILMIIFLQFSLISCKNNNQKDENVQEKYFSNYNNETNSFNIHKTETKEYYAQNRYVTFSATTDFVIEFENDNIVFFDDGTAMAKLYSHIKISLSDQNFYKNYNGIYINQSKNTILNKISTGTNTLNLKNIDLSNFKISNTINLSPIFEDFSNIGVAIYYPNNQEDEIDTSIIKIENNETTITAKDGQIFYSFLKDDIDLNNLNKTDFCYNINFDFSISESTSNLMNIYLYFDLTLTEKFVVLTIIKTNSNFEYILMTKTENNEFVLQNIENDNLINFIFKQKTQII